jgi:hypothetical protein
MAFDSNFTHMLLGEDNVYHKSSSTIHYRVHTLLLPPPESLLISYLITISKFIAHHDV